MADIKQDVERLKNELDPNNPNGVTAAVASLKSALDPKNNQGLAATVAQFQQSAANRLTTLEQEIVALKSKPANNILNPQWQKGDSQALASHAQLFKLDFSAMKADEKGLTIFGVQVMTWPWARESSKISMSFLSEKERGRRSPEAKEKKANEARESAAALERAKKERQEAQKVRDALTKLIDTLETTKKRGQSFRQTMREISNELK